MTKRLVGYAFVALMGLVVPSLFAERKTYVPDPPHSQINFVGESMLISAQGYFEKWDGDFQINRDKLEDSSVSITIDANSLNTRVQMRDSHIKGKDFLDVENFLQIGFVSKAISRLGDKSYLIEGDLTLHGITKSIKVPVTIAFLRPNDARFKGNLKINRFDYGISYNGKMNPVENDVTISFDFHLNDKAAMPARPASAPGQVPAPSSSSP